MQNSKMNKRILLFCALVLFFMFRSPVSATGTIDTNQTGNLKVYFTKQKPYAGVEFRLYKVAEISNGTSYTLTGAFADCPVILENPTTEEWRNLVTTISGYVAGGTITPDYVTKTDDNGIATFAGISLGLYLVEGSQHAFVEGITKTTIAPTSFLVKLPEVNDNIWRYDVETDCKYTLVGGREKIDVEVQKVWKDNNYSERPKQVVIELYADDQLYDTVTLKKSNNWKYCWKRVDGDFAFRVKEKNVPKGYTVSVKQQDNLFIVTNKIKKETTETDKSTEKTEGTTTDDDYALSKSRKPTLPQTGVLWWPVPVLAGAGLILILIGLIHRGNKDEE